MTEAEKLVISTQQRWTLHHKHRRKRDKIPRKQPAKSIIINIFTIHLSLILQYIPQVLWGTVGQGWSRQLVDELGGASCGHVTCGRSLLPQCPQLGEQKEGVSCEDGSGHYSHPKEAWTLAAREREREREYECMLGELDRSGNFHYWPKLDCVWQNLALQNLTLTISAG